MNRYTQVVWMAYCEVCGHKAMCANEEAANAYQDQHEAERHDHLLAPCGRQISRVEMVADPDVGINAITLSSIDREQAERRQIHIERELSDDNDR